jgi:hypothetical protein
MKREIIKEIKVGIRSGKFLILSASLVFYGLFTPIMATMILPRILASQFQGEDVSALLGVMGTDQMATMSGYMGDIYEIGTLLVTFVLCGLIAQEIRDNTLVLPLCGGSRYHEVIGAKALVYGFFLLAASLVALCADYLYSGLLIDFQVDPGSVVTGSLLQGLYFAYLVVSVLMWGALTKSPIAAGFLTLGTTFGMHFIASLFQKTDWVPSGLMTEAANFSGAASDTIMTTVGITMLLMIFMFAMTQIRLGRLEWNGR